MLIWEVGMFLFGCRYEIPFEYILFLLSNYLLLLWYSDVAGFKATIFNWYDFPYIFRMLTIFGPQYSGLLQMPSFTAWLFHTYTR